MQISLGKKYTLYTFFCILVLRQCKNRTYPPKGYYSNNRAIAEKTAPIAAVIIPKKAIIPVRISFQKTIIRIIARIIIINRFCNDTLYYVSNGRKSNLIHKKKSLSFSHLQVKRLPVSSKDRAAQMICILLVLSVSAQVCLLHHILSRRTQSAVAPLR